MSVFCIQNNFISGFRYGNFEDFLKRMDEVEGGIDNMSRGYNYYGAHVESDNTFVMRQWAPSAQVMCQTSASTKWPNVLCIVF